MSESKKEGLDIHESILYYWLTKIKYYKFILIIRILKENVFLLIKLN